MDKVEDIVAMLRAPMTMGMYVSMTDLARAALSQRASAANHIEAQQALIEEMRDALGTYMFAVEQMNSAMKDGVNVQGAVSMLIGAEDMAKFILSKALSQKDQIDG